MFIGVDNIAKKIKNCYVGVDGKSRKVKAVYVGVNGVARLVWKNIIARMGKVKNYLSVKKTTGCIAYTENTSSTSYVFTVWEYKGVVSKEPNIIYADIYSSYYDYAYENRSNNGVARFVFDSSDNLIKVDTYIYGEGSSTNSFNLDCCFELGDALFISAKNTIYSNNNKIIFNTLYNYDTKTVLSENTSGLELMHGVSFNDTIAIATHKQVEYAYIIKRNGNSLTYNMITFKDSNGRNLYGTYGDYGFKVIKLNEKKGLFMGRAYSTSTDIGGIYACAFRLNDDGSVTLGSLKYLSNSSSICNIMSTSQLYDIDETHAVFIASYRNSDSNYYKNTFIPVTIDDSLNITFGTLYQETSTLYGAMYYTRIGNGKTIGVAAEKSSSTNLLNNYGIHMYDLNTDTNTIIDRGIIYPNVNNVGEGYFYKTMPFKENKVIMFNIKSELLSGGSYKYQVTATPIISEFNFE